MVIAGVTVPTARRGAEARVPASKEVLPKLGRATVIFHFGDDLTDERPLHTRLAVFRRASRADDVPSEQTLNEVGLEDDIFEELDGFPDPAHARRVIPRLGTSGSMYAVPFLSDGVCYFVEGLAGFICIGKFPDTGISWAVFSDPSSSGRTVLCGLISDDVDDVRVVTRRGERKPAFGENAFCYVANEELPTEILVHYADRSVFSVKVSESLRE